MEPNSSGSDNAPLIVIVGETASGKSALALALAERFNGEVICADSRTVYRGLDIGTAKPSMVEREKVRHHLVDVVDPSEAFSAAEFKRLADEAICDIQSRGKLPIMVGGTGLYIDSVLFNYGFAPPDAPRDSQNPRHLSKAAPEIKQSLRSNTLIIGLQLERDALRKRVQDRVEAMVELGLIDEVQKLGQRYGWDAPALQAPGYRAFHEYLNGRLNLQEAKALFVKNDLNLAKRQRTWFRRNKSIHWLTNEDKIDKSVDLITTFLNN